MSQRNEAEHMVRARPVTLNLGAGGSCVLQVLNQRRLKYVQKRRSWVFANEGEGTTPSLKTSHTRLRCRRVRVGFSPTKHPPFHAAPLDAITRVQCGRGRTKPNQAQREMEKRQRDTQHRPTAGQGPRARGKRGQDAQAKRQRWATKGRQRQRPKQTKEKTRRKKIGKKAKRLKGKGKGTGKLGKHKKSETTRRGFFEISVRRPSSPTRGRGTYYRPLSTPTYFVYVFLFARCLVVTPFGDLARSPPNLTFPAKPHPSKY